MTSLAAPSVSVVICAYTEDRWNEMLTAVTSVSQQTLRAAEIIVVVDHNPALLRRASCEVRSATVIPNVHRKGLSGARNTGAAAATSDIVAFLDDDAFACPGWLAALIAPYAEPRVLGVGGHVTPVWVSGRPGWFPPEFDWVVGCTYRGMPSKRVAIRNFIGANMSLRRQPLIESGGFDTDLGRVATRPSGCEETELCIRLQRQRPGGVLLYEPAAMVRHQVPPARATWRYFQSRCVAEGTSKAVVTHLAGSRNALRTEKAYLGSVIPRAIIRASARAMNGDGDGARTALALAAGVMVTGAGYLAGLLKPRGNALARQHPRAPLVVRSGPSPDACSSPRPLIPIPSGGLVLSPSIPKCNRGFHQ